MAKMITREAAIATLYEFIGNNILSEELRDKLLEIANLIEIEQRGLHFWGGEIEDYHEMVVARREDLWTDEVIANAEKIEKEHTFTPAPYEKAEIEEYLADLIEE